MFGYFYEAYCIKGILEYQDKFYMLSNQRITYKRDKTEAGRFFILTLFGIAEGLHTKEKYGEEVVHVSLAVGLPPAHYEAQNQAFIQYFLGRGIVNF